MSNKSRYIIVCKNVNCPFRLTAGSNSNSGNFVIKSFVDQHDCIFNVSNSRLVQNSVKYIVNMIPEVIEELVDETTATQIMSAFRLRLNVEINYQSANRAKNLRRISFSSTHHL